MLLVGHRASLDVREYRKFSVVQGSLWNLSNWCDVALSLSECSKHGIDLNESFSVR